MGLSFDKYKEMNDKGMFYYDTSLIQHTGENLQKLLTDVNGQMRAEGTQWSDDEFKENRQKLAEYKSQLEYMQGYANSIKDSDSEAYNSLMEVYNGLSGHVGGATNWFAKNTDADKRTELYTLANQQREEQKKNIDTVSAMQAMRLGNTTAKEQAEKYGLDEKELGDAYASFRAAEKQQDREVKYGSADFNTLVDLLRNPDSMGQRIYDEIRKEYGAYLKDYSDYDKNRIYASRGEKYGLSGDEVKAIVERIDNNDDKHYASYALNEEDKTYIIQRILETGTADELKQLKKSLPVAKYYDTLRYQLNDAIEQKSEEENYLNLTAAYPRIQTVMESLAKIDAAMPAMPEGAHLHDDTLEEVRENYLNELKSAGYDAEKIYKFYQRYTERQRNTEFQKSIHDWVSANPFNAAVASVLSVPVNMIGSVTDLPKVFGARMDEVFGGDGWYDPKGTANYTAQNVRDTTVKMIDEATKDSGAWNYWAKQLYSTGTSMGDMALAAAANTIPVVGQAAANMMFFSSAGMSAANEVVENGGDLSQATKALIAQGGAELLFERISLDKLEALAVSNDVTEAKEYFKNIVKQAFVEGSEEFNTTLANTLTDAFINGGNNSVSREIRKYMEQGKSEAEAESLAIKSWTEGIISDTIGGMMSGGVLGGAAGAKAAANSNIIVEVNGQAVSRAEKASLIGNDSTKAEKTALEIIKKQGVEKTLEAAKNSVDDTIRETAEHFLEVNEQGKLNKKDAAALFVRAAKAQAVNDSVASLVGEQTSAEYHEVKSFTAQQYSGYDETGARIGTENRQDSGKVKTRAFGKSHPNGVSIHDAQGNAQIVTGIDSSMNEYGKQGKTVTLTLNNGETVDAASVTFDDSNLERLANLAANYDTLGARALLANWESAQQGGVSIDDYIGMFQYFYEKGGDGVTFDSALQNAQDKAHAAAIGYDAARAAIEAGMNDRDISTRTQSYFQKKVRVPGKSFVESRVSVERGVTAEIGDDTKTMLQAIADKTGKNIVLTEALDESTYGQFKDNEILINAKKAEHAMFTTALHEATHNAKVYDPEGYRALEKFITNYLTAQGMDVQRRLDDLAVSYPELAENRAALREELVCKTVEALATDEKAFQKAIASKENRGILKKLGEFLHRIAEAVKNYFKGDRANNVLAHNLHAQAFMDDAAALDRMAKMCSQMYDTAKKNEAKYGSRENGERFAKENKSDSFIKDKYFDRQIDKWNNLEDGRRVKVGSLKEGSALNQVGFPATDMWFDVGKIKKAFSDHADHITENIIKRIPELMNDPIAITEYRGSKGTINNTASVYGIIMPDGKTPVAVGVVMTKHSNGKTIINKIRTVHARSNTVINDDNILYLNDDKKKTRKWFQVCGISVPLDGTKFGYIRSISYVDKNNNTSEQNNYKGNDNTRYSKDDTIYDWEDDVVFPFLDEEDEEDLLRTPDIALNRDGKIDTKTMLKNSTPDSVIYSLYNSISNTAVKSIAESSAVKLDEGERLAIARRVMNAYKIIRGNNPGLDTKIAQRIEEFISGAEGRSKADVSTLFNGLVTDCRAYLKNSGKYERGYMQKTAEKVKGKLHGKTLILPLYAENYILGDYYSVDNLNHTFGGYIKVVREGESAGVKNAVYMHELIRDLSEIQAVRELFPDGKTPDDLSGWGFLDNLINSALQPKFVNPYYNNAYENIDDAAVEMAGAILTAIVDEKAAKSVKDKKLDRTTVKLLSDSRKKAVAANNALHNVKFEKYRSLKKVNNYFVNMEKTNFRKEYIERQRKAAVIRQLGRKLNSLTKRLDGKAPKNEYIPETLKKPILNVLELFRVDPGKYKSGEQKNIPAHFGAFRQLGAVSARVNELANAYELLKDADHSGDKYENLGFDINALAYSDGVLNDLRELAELVKDKNVYQMDAAELNLVLDVMNELDNKLKQSVEIIIDGKKTTIYEATAEGIEQTNAVKFNKDSKLLLADTVRQLRNKFVATSLDPVRYGRMLSGYKDDGVICQLMSELHSGEQKKILLMQRSYSVLQDIIAKYKRKDLVALQRDAVDQFTMKDIETGADVKLSQGMLLSIYLTDMQADGHLHLANERANLYTRVADLDYLNKNRLLPDVKGNRQRATGEKSHKIRLNTITINQIKEYVESTPLLKDLAKGIHDVFNHLLADEINKVSLQREGRMIATVKNYFPIKVDSNDPYKKFELKAEGLGIFTDDRLKSRGFTKQRVKSETAIVIGDALEVFQRHVNETSEYCGMLIPVENLKKVLNCDNGDVSMRESLERKFGGDALHYLDKLLGDIQKRKDNADENFLTRAAGHAMGAALAVNPRSMVKNWAAMPLANRYFGVGNVSKATVMGFVKGKSLVEKYNEYTPYMWYRAQGNGTVVGELSRQHGLYGRFGEKLDIMSWADQKVVNSLLYAAEQHVKQTTDLVYDSDEFKREVARQFEKCVDETQPNSMITSKPQFVRNNVMRVLSLNAFASQRMAMGNCIIDSFMEYSARRYEYGLDKNADTKKAKNEAKKKFARSIIGMVESGLLQSLLGALATVLVYHKWDDYKDEEGNVTFASFFGGLKDNTLKGLPEEVVGGFAWLDKIYSGIEKLIDSDAYGADFNVMSLSAVTDIADAVNRGNWWKAWGRAADMFGIPLFLGTNVQRLLQSGENYLEDAYHGRLGYLDNKGKVDLTYIGVQIANAMKNSDTQQAELLTSIWENELIGKGQSTSSIPDKIGKSLLEVDDSITEAVIAKENGNYKRYMEFVESYTSKGVSEEICKKASEAAISAIKNELKEDGFLEDKEKLIQELVVRGFNDSAANKLVDDWTKTKSESGSGIKYTLTDAFTAKKNGEADSYELVRDYLAEQYVEEGTYSTKEKAVEYVDKQMTSATHTKSLFQELEDATDNGPRKRLDRINRELVNVFGSREAAMEAYRKYKKDKDKKK